MKKMIAVMTVVLAVAAVASAETQVTQSFTEGYRGWGSSNTIDFTQAYSVNGVYYFAWDPLTIDAEYTGGQFVFDITMPRDLTGQDNFDLVIDVNNNGIDDDGDFLVHYANTPVNYWVDTWDAKVYQSGWTHQDELPLGVTANKIDQQNFTVTVNLAAAGGGPISFAWLSPIGDEGYPESWPGEAVIVSNWASGNGLYTEVTPEPASMSLLGLGAVALIRRRRR